MQPRRRSFHHLFSSHWATIAPLVKLQRTLGRGSEVNDYAAAGPAQQDEAARRYPRRLRRERHVLEAALWQLGRVAQRDAVDPRLPQHPIPWFAVPIAPSVRQESESAAV